MNYSIEHAIPGRVRLNCGRFTFSKTTALAMLSVLQDLCVVKKAKVSHITGSIIVFFSEGNLKEVLEAVAEVDADELKKTEICAVLNSQDDEFTVALAKKIALKYIITPFLPVPVRTAIVLFNAFRFIKKAVRQIFRERRIGVEVLDAAAITVSLLQNSQSTAGSIMFLLSISEMIENWTEAKSKANLAQSLALHVDKVWIFKDGQESLISSSCIEHGDIVIVRTGSLIPVDGIVISGEAMVNQSTMTGEPLAIKRDSGKTVFAGTIVEEGRIYIKVLACHNDTRINRIVNMINDSENYKSSWQSKNEHIADAIVPFSFFGALGVYLLTGSFAKAATVLLVDFSCAIKLSTHLTVLSALRETATHNVAVKGGKFLEALAEADTIAFDKTGTLTHAKPVVTEVIALDGYTRTEVLKISACLEEHFPHTVAQAVVKRALDEGIDHMEEHSQVEYIIAHGIVSMIGDKRALIGSEHFIFEDEGVPYPDELRESVDLQIGDKSALYLAIDNILAGVILIDDPVKPDAAELIEELKKVGISRIVMLTGDSRKNAESVADQLGITEFKAQMLPEDKARYISELRSVGRKVIMVGDGVNDTPALSAANLGVSMQNGSDIAREVADVALFTQDLKELVAARKISLSVMQKIKNNYWFVLSFNSILLALGLSQVISPAVSATLHNLSTIGIGIKSLMPVLPKAAEPNSNPEN